MAMITIDVLRVLFERPDVADGSDLVALLKKFGPPSSGGAESEDPFQRYACYADARLMVLSQAP